ncbi:hypothetical protein ABH935_001277 [Catenulispora sp. GAS73]|uniref:hypothetical protein n=1 Tax=Catenulispora sp. GAS73 TaxID=3156269 RepID=UPI003517473E
MEDALVGAVRRVLTHLRNPRRPSDRLLETWPGLGSLQAVNAFVRTEIDAMAGSASPVDQEAAEILRLYYLGRSTGHDVTAHRVHLSRATYFRRLDYGIRCLAEAVRALDVVEG